MERKLYDLSISQDLIFQQLHATFNKACMNIPISLVFHGADLDPALMEKALRMGISRWDTFGIRILKEKKDGKAVYKQYFGDRAALSIEHKDFTGQSPEKMEAFFRKEAKRGIPFLEAPMARFFILRTPKGEPGFYSVISHMILDSWGIVTFYQDVINLYGALRDGTELPREPRLHEPVLVRDLDYPNTEAFARDAAFWAEEFKKPEPLFTHPAGTAILQKNRRKKGMEKVRYGDGWFPFAKGKMDLHYIGKDVVDKMRAFAEANSLSSITPLFQMALRMHLARVNDRTDTVQHLQVMARRSTLDEKLSGGNRVGCTFVRSTMPEGMTFLEGLNLLTSWNNEVFRHANYDPRQLFGQLHKAYHLPITKSYQSTNLTFQPLPVQAGGLDIEARWHSHETSSMPLYITVMDGDGKGSLKCYYEYIAKQYGPNTIREMHEYMVRVLLKGMEDPGVTVGELFEA